MSLPFHPDADLLEARVALQQHVDVVLARLAEGAAVPDVEREAVDLKEEAGRRGAGGVLQPGTPHNQAASEALADEVACMANTPGGGALVVGVENRTGDLLGAGLDADWLRHRVYQLVDVAPLVEERHVAGVRLLVVFVGEAREPVEDRSGRVRWRTGAACEPVDRVEWWTRRQERAGHDPMGAPSRRTLSNVSTGALVEVRRLLRQPGASEAAVASAAETDPELLRRLGALLPDGRLTQAAALLLCPAAQSWIELTVLDVEGGNVLAPSESLEGLSLLEQVRATEVRLDALNTSVTLHLGFQDALLRRLPQRTLREAVLNGVVHRDWMSRQPVRVTWFDADSAVQVDSPGGFSGGVTADTALTQRYARSPALADLFRALGLVERWGLGVDRMVQEMVSRGHRRPHLVETTGPSVRLRLVGGNPVVPVLNLTRRLLPRVRQEDVRVALVIFTLLRQPFVTPESLVPVLQRDAVDCREALDAAAECVVDEQALLSTYKDVWTLSRAAVFAIESVAGQGELRRSGVLTYRRPPDALTTAQVWLQFHDRITSGDHAVLTGLTQAGALGQLERLAAEGLLVRGAGLGRSAHFRAGPALADRR